MESYCNLHPEWVINNSVAPEQASFPKDTIMKLQCKEGYKAFGDMLATCAYYLPDIGMWTANSTCESTKPISLRRALKVQWGCQGERGENSPLHETEKFY